jgi:hypothetical protein
MILEKEYFESWMKRFMERFDILEKRNMSLANSTKCTEKVQHTYNGELLLDNYDLCKMLNVGKRSLQRYRSLGWLPYKQIDQKIYYLESEVEKFITEHFETRRKK